MGGRDPSEDHRAATPLELLFDLTFVIAFGAAANELAHLLAEGHIGTALLGFSFATFGIALGVDQLLLVRLGLRHRRLDLPAGHDGADDRRADPRPRPAGHVRVARRRRHGRQPGHGRRLHRDARWRWSSSGCGPPGRTRRAARPATRTSPPPGGPGRVDRAADRRDVGRSSRSSGSWSWCSSSSPGRSSPRPARSARRGTPTTSPSATGCW